MADFDWFGIPVYVSPALPVVPSPGQDARRMVRHGMAEILEWLGEEVGPAPGARTHAILASDFGTERQVTAAFVSRELLDQIKDRADG